MRHAGFAWATRAVLTALIVAACSNHSPPEVIPATSPSTSAPSASTPNTRAIAKSDPVHVTGPVSGGHGIALQHAVDLNAQHYTEEEFFVDGAATSYAPAGGLAADGRWTIKSGATAPFRTRIVVRRPQDPARFSGVVLV